MNRQIRRKKEMAVRVRDFSHAHPSADPSFVSILGRLEEGINRLVALEGQQTGGFLSKHSSTVRRREVRRRLREGLLRHLVTIGQDAAAEQPQLLEMFRLPAHNITNGAFQNLSRKLLEQGVAQKELLVKHGLSDTLLDDLTAAVGEFDASVAETNGGLNDHVLAGAELRRVSDEITQLVAMMDGVNRYRFEREPQLLVAWESAKHVVTGPLTAEEKKSEPPGVPVEPAQPGEVKPAA
jgi:hypothetical protein